MLHNCNFQNRLGKASDCSKDANFLISEIRRYLILIPLSSPKIFFRLPKSSGVTGVKVNYFSGKDDQIYFSLGDFMT